MSDDLALKYRNLLLDQQRIQRELEILQNQLQTEKPNYQLPNLIPKSQESNLIDNDYQIINEHPYCISDLREEPTEEEMKNAENVGIEEPITENSANPQNEWDSRSEFSILSKSDSEFSMPQGQIDDTLRGLQEESKDKAEQDEAELDEELRNKNLNSLVLYKDRSLHDYVKPSEGKKESSFLPDSLKTACIVAYKTYTYSKYALPAASIVGKSALTNFTAGLASKTTWVATAAMFLLETGYYIYQCCDNQISVSTLFKKVAILGVSSAAGVVAGVGGVTVGGILGSAICPGVGTIIGAVVGGLLSGILAQWLAKKAMEEWLKIPENEREELQRRKLYKDSLKEYGATEKTSELDIEKMRKLKQLKWHPDKNLGNEEYAKEMFIKEMTYYLVIKEYRRSKGEWKDLKKSTKISVRNENRGPMALKK